MSSIQPLIVVRQRVPNLADLAETLVGNRHHWRRHTLGFLCFDALSGRLTWGVGFSGQLVSSQGQSVSSLETYPSFSSPC